MDFGTECTELPEHHRLKHTLLPRYVCSVSALLVWGQSFESSTVGQRCGVTLSIFCWGPELSPLPTALLRGVPWNIFEINVSRHGCSITFCLNSLQ